MDRMQEALESLAQTAALMKLGRIIEEDATLQAAFEAAPDDLQNFMLEQLGADKAPESPADILALYRKAVGEEMWATISTNPSLSTMAQEHLQKVAKKALEALCDKLHKMFLDAGHDEVTRDDVAHFINYGLGS